jgi:hypothetical protein
LTRFRKTFTFSNVIACIALFAALGGSVYAAGKINGKQIKRNSLPGNRIKPKSVKPNRIKPKSLTGRQVKPRSLTDTQINQQTLDEISAASLANVHYESVEILLPNDGRPATRATANCPAGTNVIGGGATVSNDEGRINENGPTGLRTGWTATGFAWFSSTTTMTVTAICARVEQPTGAAQTAPSPKYQPAG